MSALRVAVAGMVAGDAHQGGAIWAVLQYVLGLRALGHDAIMLEEVDDARFDDAAARFRALASWSGGRAALVGRPSGRVAGLSRGELERLLVGADLLLNLSGILTDERLLGRFGTRAYVDLDPGFTQLWHAAGDADMGFIRHDRFVTIGRGIGAPGSRIPACGRDWIETPQPICLDRWPVARCATDGALTTVGHWRAYGSIHHEGVHYGQKAHALRPLLDLPRRSGARFRLALGIHPGERDDLAALRGEGWELVEPVAAAGTPAAYREFVQGSWAEFGLAKLGYVAGRCGWFSDRSVCYLASGRPVVAHDTGFREWLPAGEGVLAFSDADGAIAAIEALRADYARHRRAARALAEEVFGAELVLGRLLERLGAAAPRALAGNGARPRAARTPPQAGSYAWA